MKTFKEFMEAYHATANNPTMRRPIEIFKNPSRKELIQSSENGMVRGWIHGNGNLYIHNARDSTHSDAKPHIPQNSQALPVMMRHDTKTKTTSITPSYAVASPHWERMSTTKIKDHINNHTHMKKLFKSTSLWNYEKE